MKQLESSLVSSISLQTGGDVPVTVTHYSFYCSGECEVRMAVEGSVMRRRRILVRAHLGWAHLGFDSG